MAIAKTVFNVDAWYSLTLKIVLSNEISSEIEMPIALIDLY